MLTKTPRLLLTRGLPGSGKSTWARQMSKKYENVHLISRDDIRNTLYAQYDFKNRSLEDFITKQQRTQVINSLLHGYDVIIHDTNINPTSIRKLKKSFARFAEIYLVDFTDVTVQTCIQRDLVRAGSKAYVGENVINRMAKSLEKYPNDQLKVNLDILTRMQSDKILSCDQEPRKRISYIPDTNLPDTIIIDMDGTLADIGDRSPFDAGRSHLDTLNSPIAKLTKSFTKTVILTGRDEKHRETTKTWLAKHKVYYEKLLMRPNDDKRPDYVVKQEIFFNDIAPYYNVELVVEDRQQVVDMWRELGIICAQIDEGDF